MDIYNFDIVTLPYVMDDSYDKLTIQEEAHAVFPRNAELGEHAANSV